VLALALVSLALAVPAPKVTAAPVQGSPVLVRIAPRPGTLRLVCAVDRLRARTCRRTNRLKLSAGRHKITAWAIGRRGRASARRSVTVVVPRPAPTAVAVGGQPVGIAAFDSALWVSDGSGGNVVRIDPSTRTVTARVPVGGQLGGIAANETGVWVSAFETGELVRIDPVLDEVAGRVAVGGHPTAIAFDTHGAIWVGDLDGRLVRVDPTSMQVTAAVPFASGVSSLLSVADLIWVGLQSGSLVPFDPGLGTSAGAAIAVSPDVDAIARTPAGLWVSTFDGLAARVNVATRQVVRRVRLPGRGGGIAWSGHAVWVSVYDRAYAVALDPLTGAYLDAVRTGGQPRESLLLDDTLWIVDQAAGALTPVALG
jgi:streptogramin lyase